mgnify:CR=1 FL=1
MKRRLFEDSEIPDVQRQVTGIGSNTMDPGATRMDSLIRKQNDLPNAHDTGVPYPLDSIDPIIADLFLNLNNVQIDLEIAKSNPTLKNEKDKELISKLEGKLKDITKILVDFDETLAIIKGNE